jgi:thiol:disulfide interchange protein DsbD
MDNKIEKHQPNTYVLTFDGIIEKTGMCIRSLLGRWSIAIRVIFKTKRNFNLEGKAKESKTKTAYNDIFEVNETFFKVSANTTDCSCNESKVSTIKLS